MVLGELAQERARLLDLIGDGRARSRELDRTMVMPGGQTAQPSGKTVPSSTRGWSAEINLHADDTGLRGSYRS